MRQLIVRVPRGCGSQVLEFAETRQAANLACFTATDRDAVLDVVLVGISNAQVGGLLDDSRTCRTST